MITKLHPLSAIKIDPDALGGVSVTLGAIRDQSLRIGLDVRQEPTSGAVYSQFQAAYAGAPVIGFGTNQLGRAIDATGSVALAIASSTYTGLTLFGNAKSKGGTRKSGANHLKYNMKEGILVPRRITAEHQGDALLNYEAHATWDGTNDPIVETESVAILSSILDDQRYSLGPVQLGTTNGDKITLTQKTRFEFDLGQNVQAYGADSDIWPTFSVVDDIARPVLRITILDVTLLKAAGIPIYGKSVDLNKTVIFLRKRLTGTSTGFVPDATAQHIAITPLAGCAYMDNAMDASGSANGTAVIEIPLIGDGTSPAFSISTTSAIVLP